MKFDVPGSVLFDLKRTQNSEDVQRDAERLKRDAGPGSPFNKTFMPPDRMLSNIDRSIVSSSPFYEGIVKGVKAESVLQEIVKDYFNKNGLSRVVHVYKGDDGEITASAEISAPMTDINGKNPASTKSDYEGQAQMQHIIQLLRDAEIPIHRYPISSSNRSFPKEWKGKLKEGAPQSVSEMVIGMHKAVNDYVREHTSQDRAPGR